MCLSIHAIVHTPRMYVALSGRSAENDKSTVHPTEENWRGFFFLLWCCVVRGLGKVG